MTSLLQTAGHIGGNQGRGFASFKRGEILTNRTRYPAENCCVSFSFLAIDSAGHVPSLLGSLSLLSRPGLCTGGTFWTLHYRHILDFVLGALFGLCTWGTFWTVLGARFGFCTGGTLWTLHYRQIWDFVLGASFGLCTIGTVWTLYWGAHFVLCTGGTQGVGIAQLVQRPTEKQYRRGLESLVRHGVFLPESAASADYAHGVSTSPVYNRIHRHLCAR